MIRDVALSPNLRLGHKLEACGHLGPAAARGTAPCLAPSRSASGESRWASQERSARGGHKHPCLWPGRARTANSSHRPPQSVSIRWEPDSVPPISLPNEPTATRQNATPAHPAATAPGGGPEGSSLPGEPAAGGRQARPKSRAWASAARRAAGHRVPRKAPRAQSVFICVHPWFQPPPRSPRTPTSAAHATEPAQPPLRENPRQSADLFDRSSRMPGRKLEARGHLGAASRGVTHRAIRELLQSLARKAR